MPPGAPPRTSRRIRGHPGLLALLWISCALPACASAPAITLPAAVDQPLALATPTGDIHGSLDLPAAAGPVPVALLIAGSGPTDRNGNIAGMPGGNYSHRMLARALADRGVASVRYDKRGIGESAAAAPSEAELRFETYAEDAAAWIRQLSADPRFSTLTVVGHSEGSLIGMLAARQAEADAFISIAGIARRASAVLRDQLRPALPPALWQESERILEHLERGEVTDSVPPALAALYRPSVQPYVISWLQYLPTDEIARLSIPTLVIQGTTDVQVTVDEAEALALARPGAELAIVEGMNHVFKLVSGDVSAQQPSYFDPDLPIVEELVERIAAFILGITPR